MRNLTQLPLSCLELLYNPSKMNQLRQRAKILFILYHESYILSFLDTQWLDVEAWLARLSSHTLDHNTTSIHWKGGHQRIYGCNVRKDLNISFAMVGVYFAETLPEIISHPMVGCCMVRISRAAAHFRSLQHPHWSLLRADVRHLSHSLTVGIWAENDIKIGDMTVKY